MFLIITESPYLLKFFTENMDVLVCLFAYNFVITVWMLSKLLSGIFTTCFISQLCCIWKLSQITQDIHAFNFETLFHTRMFSLNPFVHHFVLFCTPFRKSSLHIIFASLQNDCVQNNNLNSEFSINEL